MKRRYVHDSVQSPNIELIILSNWMMRSKNLKPARGHMVCETILRHAGFLVSLYTFWSLSLISRLTLWCSSAVYCQISGDNRMNWLRFAEVNTYNCWEMRYIGERLSNVERGEGIRVGKSVQSAVVYISTRLAWMTCI